MDNYEEIKNKIEGKNKKHYILNFFKLILSFFVLVLSFLIYAKNDEDASFLSKVFNVNVSFKAMNEKISYQISTLLSSLNIFKKDEEKTHLVSTPINYISLGNNYYSFESNEIPLLFKGKILNINTFNDTYNVNVYFENGINACYYDILNIYVNKGDIVNRNETIGNYETQFKVIFAKNNQIISYEEALLS